MWVRKLILRRVKAYINEVMHVAVVEVGDQFIFAELFQHHQIVHPMLVFCLGPLKILKANSLINRVETLNHLPQSAHH
jgi:hypothetical protein